MIKQKLIYCNRTKETNTRKRKIIKKRHVTDRYAETHLFAHSGIPKKYLTGSHNTQGKCRINERKHISKTKSHM